MKKLIAILALTAAVATPAFASDGSESVMQSLGRSGYVATTAGTDSYAFAPRGNWQNMENGQWSTPSQISDR
jgi:hypothetical protein